jgi:hypothetical protein
MVVDAIRERCALGADEQHLHFHRWREAGPTT